VKLNIIGFPEFLEEKNAWGKRLVRTVLLAVIGWKVLTRMQEQGSVKGNLKY